MATSLTVLDDNPNLDYLSGTVGLVHMAGFHGPVATSVACGAEAPKCPYLISSLGYFVGTQLLKISPTLFM